MPDQPASFTEALRLLVTAEMDEAWTMLPGQVTSWHRPSQLVTVRPLVSLADGTALPVLPDVPVIFPTAYQDLEALDVAGVLIISSLEWRRWWRTEQVGPPEIEGRSGLSGAVFLPGLASYAQSRDLPANATVLAKPRAAGTVRLGDVAATKAVVHEDYLSAIDTYLTVLDTWGAAVEVATGVPWAPVLAAHGVLRAGDAAGDHQSPSVKVED